MFDSISSIAGRIAAIDERARRLNVAWATDTATGATPAASDPTADTPAASGTTTTGTPAATESTTFAAAMADTKATKTAARAASRTHAAATTPARAAATSELDAQLGALKGGSRHAHTAGVAAASTRSTAPATATASAKTTAAAPAAASAPAPAAAPAAATAPPAPAAASRAPAVAATTAPSTQAADTVATSGTVTAEEDATAPVIDPALGAYGYRSAAAWDPTGPVGQLVAKYGINKGTYIDLGSPAAVVGRGATPEEMKILAGSGAFGTPGTYPGLDYSYFTGLEGTTGIDKLADGTPVPANMAVWTVWKNGQIIHQEIASPNIDSTKMSIQYLGFA